MSSQTSNFRYSIFQTGDSKVILSRNIAKYDHHFGYALCDEKKLSNTIDCKVIVGTLPLSDKEKSMTERICQINSTTSGHVTNSSFEIDMLTGGRKTLISWIEHGSNTEWMEKYVVIVDMDTCDLTKLKFLIYNQDSSENILISNLVVYEESFDVFVSDSQWCGLYDKCKITFNETGQVMSEIKYFMPDLWAVRTVSAFPGSSKKGYYTFTGSVTMSPKIYPVQLEHLLFSDSVLKMNLISTILYNSSISLPIVSNTHNVFTICGIENHTVHCNQFRVGDAVPLIDISFYLTGNIAAVHNVALGGFLIFDLQCDQNETLTCSSYKITKIDLDEQKTEISSGQLMEPLQCSGKFDRIVVEGKDHGEDVCFYIACVQEIFKYGRHFKNEIIFRRECYSVG
ncbi:hypothetical protein QAD02_023876 [Eretmocerus hayati]|uniref:Uncharacterized protein n=1 Tax=Eretmocerus hayati TaxID=131215 RepID=A0ACC2PYR5_9HYME|nr:hypothetical protein QAD02_023876 [Eretmocerus hayati]